MKYAMASGFEQRTFPRLSRVFLPYRKGFQPLLMLPATAVGAGRALATRSSLC
jgi:hypothetical protein